MPRKAEDRGERCLGTLWYCPDGSAIERAKSTYENVWLDLQPVEVNGRRYFRMSRTNVKDWERCWVRIKYPMPTPWGWGGKRRNSKKRVLAAFVDQHQWYCDDGRLLTDAGFRAETGR